MFPVANVEYTLIEIEETL